MELRNITNDTILIKFLLLYIFKYYFAVVTKNVWSELQGS